MTTLSKRTITGFGLALGLLATTSPLQAGWVSVNTINQTRLDNAPNNSDYWDGASWDDNDSTTLNGGPAGDGTPRGVGYYLTSTGFYGNPAHLGLGLGTYSYNSGTEIATGSGLDYHDLNGLIGMQFSTGSGSSADGTVTMTIEISWQHTSNQLWILSGASATPSQIFAGGANPSSGGSYTFTGAVNNPYTLILVDTENNKAYFSTGEVFGYTNPDGTWYAPGGLVQTGWKTSFAVFKETGDVNGDDLYVGIEDLRNGDDDYNDMVLHIHSNAGGGVLPTPAPPAIVLALVGILPCLALRRRLVGKTA